MFHCRHSCGAYVIKYILEWDGEQMAKDFTEVRLCYCQCQIATYRNKNHYLTCTNFACTGRRGCFEIQYMHEAASF